MRCAVFAITKSLELAKERAMGEIAGISEPASEPERLIADLSESGLLVFVSASAGGRRT